MRLICLPTLALAALPILAAEAEACVQGARCLTAPESAPLPYAVGDTLPRGKYMLLLNSEYYGLPPAPNGGMYYRVEDRVMVVRPDTLEILDDVTDSANDTF